MLFYMNINLLFRFGGLYEYKPPFSFSVFYMCINPLFPFGCFTCESTATLVLGVLYVYKPPFLVFCTCIRQRRRGARGWCSFRVILCCVWAFLSFFFRSEEFRFSLGQITWPLYWSNDIAYSHFCECCCQTSCKTGKRCSFPLFFFKHKTSTCFLNVYSVSNISFPFLDLFPCLCFLSEETRNSVYMFSSTFSSMFCSFCISVCFPCRTVILFVYLYNHWLSCLHL